MEEIILKEGILIGGNSKNECLFYAVAGVKIRKTDAGIIEVIEENAVTGQICIKPIGSLHHFTNYGDFIAPQVWEKALKQIPVGDVFLSKMKSLCTKVDFDKVVSAVSIPNRIAEILSEKGISPLLESEDLAAMNLESEQQWFAILRNELPPYFYHPDASRQNLLQIMKWLDVSMCDIYGKCFATEMGELCNCKSKESEKRWRNGGDSRI